MTKEASDTHGQTKPAQRRMVAAWVLAFSLLLGHWCLGIPPVFSQCTAPGCSRPAAANPAVVRVAVAGAAGSRTYGSGTLVRVEQAEDGGPRAARGVVLTCGHLFGRGQGPTTVTFPDGRCFAAAVLEIDPTWDLAALAITPPGVTPVPVADAYPQPGQPLESCGYGREGRYWCNRGRALGYARTANTGSYETLQLTGTAREGDSGGPVLDGRGELVAVLWGTDGRMVAGTYCGRIRRFLARIFRPGRSPAGEPAPAPGGPQPASPTQPAQNALKEIRHRLDGLAGGLDDANRQWGDQRQSLFSRLEKVEKAIAVAGAIKQRLEQAQPAAADRSPVVPGPSPVEALLPGLLAALGWTGPPSIAAILAARLAVRLLRRKAGRPAAAGAPDHGGAPGADAGRRLPLNDDYAAQLARVYALSGHSQMADATLGREYDEELRQAEQSSDGTLAGWATKLRQRVAQRFYRIHGEAPTPAEPIQS